MISRFYLKRNDTLPKLTLALKNALGAVVDLSTASSVKFTMSPMNAEKFEPLPNPIVDHANATVEDDVNGIVSYQFQAADTASDGVFVGEFECTFPTGVETFPNTVKNRLEIIISKDG